MKIPTLWLGDGESYQQVLKAYEWGMKNPDYRPPESKLYSDNEEDGDDEDEDVTFLEFLAQNQISTYGNVGVIDIDGPLVNDESFWNRLFGLVSYNTLSTAVNMLIEDPEITQIVLNMGTPGGDSQGLEGFTDNLTEAGKLKPITAWSGTNALSAGYWIAAAANKVKGSRMAQFGSIGVITTATNYAEMLKKEGIKVEVIRAGEYKALAHPAEPLSEKAKKELTDVTQKLYGFFLGHVARHRDVDIGNKEAWAEGRTFFSAEAIPIGLVDEVITLNGLVDQLTETQATGEHDMPTQVILDQDARDQLADWAKRGDAQDPDSADTELSQGGGGEQAEPDPVPAGPDAGEPGADPAASRAGDASSTVTEARTELVAYLQEQNQTLLSEVADLKAAQMRDETRLKEFEEQNEGLLNIAICATHDLQIRLGQRPAPLTGLPTGTVMTYYLTCKKEFEEKFKTGRQSLDAGADSEQTALETARSLGITPIAG